MRNDKPLKQRINEQFEECEDDPNWYRCKVCNGKFHYGESRKDDLLRHLDSHD